MQIVVIPIFYQQGGFSTADEMCVSFLFHYPRIQLMNCISKPLYDTFHSDSNPLKMVGTDLSGEFESMDWQNSSVADLFNDGLAASTYFMLCGSIHHEVRLCRYLLTMWSIHRKVSIMWIWLSLCTLCNAEIHFVCGSIHPKLSLWRLFFTVWIHPPGD